ncbi:hypothetical protein HZA86_02905 [Candidatus Uhrbacteria bacterium]|nr:hypothetical protein [Candidatus Uhrbacteria bacterium]
MKLSIWLLGGVFAVIAGSASVGILYTTRAQSVVGANIAKNKEDARPANIEITVISDKDCKECFDVTPTLTEIERANVAVTAKRTLDRIDEEAKAMIAQYAIQRLPTIIIRGEVQKQESFKTALAQFGDVTGDTFVLRKIGGPSVVASTGEIKGKTTLTLLRDSSCSQCYEVQKHRAILYRFGLTPTAFSVVDVNAAEGRALVKKYGISLVPAFVLTGEVTEYSDLLTLWPTVGIVNNGAYVFTQGVPTMGVYKDLKTGKIIDPDKIAKQESAQPNTAQ